MLIHLYSYPRTLYSILEDYIGDVQANYKLKFRRICISIQLYTRNYDLETLERMVYEVVTIILQPIVKDRTNQK